MGKPIQRGHAGYVRRDLVCDRWDLTCSYQAGYGL